MTGGRYTRAAAYTRAMWRPLAALVAAVAALAAGPPGGAVHWRHSVSLGAPWHGALAGGVELPSHGGHFFTWDPLLHGQPDRAWRRYGNEELVQLVLRVVDAYARAHPRAPRVGIGDLSRPHGGYFGPKHVSHQNGLDVDVYYPRLDGRERPPDRADQIDHALAQDLVARFVRAGAVHVFVGPSTDLAGPPNVVQALVGHDNHMHVRISAAGPARYVIGRSVRGRRIWAVEVGDRSLPPTLVVGCIHGNECAGTAIVDRLVRVRTVHLWLIPTLNPDGMAADTRQNAHGVDLNQNWPTAWRRHGQPWSTYYSGPRPLSEPESRIGLAFITRIHPRVTIWYHQHMNLVYGSGFGPDLRAEHRYAALTGMRWVRLPAPHGAATRWQRHTFPDAAAFVVELPAGAVSPAAARLHAAAVVALSQ